MLLGGLSEKRTVMVDCMCIIILSKNKNVGKKKKKTNKIDSVPNTSFKIIPLLECFPMS
jgi:hypothetical protein